MGALAGSIVSRCYALHVATTPAWIWQSVIFPIAGTVARMVFWTTRVEITFLHVRAYVVVR